MNVFTAGIAAIIWLLIIVLNADKISNAPKIVTQGGSIVIKAGDGGDIVFEPSDGRQVRIGSNVLNVTSSEGPRGDKGDKGDHGDQGAPGMNGSNGEKGAPGVNGTAGPKGNKGDTGDQGPRGDKGPSGSALDPHAKCNNASDAGQLRFADGYLQVCTATNGWKKVVYQDESCQGGGTNVAQRDLDTFKKSNFGVLFQFKGNLKANRSPGTTINITAVYQDTASNGSSPAYQISTIDQALNLTGAQHVDIDGLPADLWKRTEWSVMVLLKISEQGLDANKEVRILASGVADGNKGFHIGIRDQVLLSGFYSNDLSGSTKLNYDQWYHVTFTWKNRLRQIYINGALEATQDNVNQYLGNSDNSEIGAWWTTASHNNILIDTLYIVDQYVDYSAHAQNEKVTLCYAKSVKDQMP